MRQSQSQGPPWEAHFLVGHHLDPKTLAVASCASKSWFHCLSSDPLWQPLCSAAFPSLHRHCAASAAAAVPYRLLYAVGYTAARRRLRKPPKPALSLDSLVFALGMESPKQGVAKTVIKPCGSLKVDPNGLFRFDVDVADDVVWSVDALDGVRVTWHVVVEGWKEVFCMMECGGKSSGGVNGWFSEELPSPGCCSSGVASGLVGDLRLGLRFLDRGGADAEVAVERVSVGVLSIYSWRYVSVDAALAYLQHFLSQV